MNKEYLTYKCFTTFLKEKMKDMKQDYKDKLKYFECARVSSIKENNKEWQRICEDKILELNSKIDTINIYLRDYEEYFKSESDYR